MLLSCFQFMMGPGGDLSTNVSHCRILDDTSLNWVSSAPAAILLVCNTVFTVWIMVVSDIHWSQGEGKEGGTIPQNIWDPLRSRLKSMVVRKETGTMESTFQNNPDLIKNIRSQQLQI